MPRRIATVDMSTRHREVVIHQEIGRLWMPTHGSATDLADVALGAAGWSRSGDWTVTAGVHAAPVEPDPGHAHDQYDRDLEIGDERRGGTR